MVSSTHQIVYLSRATQRYSEQALADIELKAATNNSHDGITGLLVYDGIRFLQAIEGPEPVLRQTMKRICADPRHHAIDVVTDRHVDAPQFGEWGMVLRRAEPGTCSRRFIADLRGEVERLDNPALQAVFIGFALLGCRPGQATV